MGRENQDEWRNAIKCCPVPSSLPSFWRIFIAFAAVFDGVTCWLDDRNIWNFNTYVYAFDSSFECFRCIIFNELRCSTPRVLWPFSCLTTKRVDCPYLFERGETFKKCRNPSEMLCRIRINLSTSSIVANRNSKSPAHLLLLQRRKKRSMTHKYTSGYHRLLHIITRRYRVGEWRCFLWGLMSHADQQEMGLCFLVGSAWSDFRRQILVREKKKRFDFVFEFPISYRFSNC